MKKLTILVSILLVVIIGGGILFYFAIYVPQQENSERIERERQERSKPCYGIKLLDWSVREESVMFNYHENLYVKVRNSSNMNKYVKLKFKTRSGWKYKQIKVYANDIFAGELYSCDYKDCFKGGVEVYDCE